MIKSPIKRGHRSRFLNASTYFKLKVFRRARRRSYRPMHEIEKNLGINRTTLNRWVKKQVHEVSACYAIGILLCNLGRYKSQKSQKGRIDTCKNLIKMLNEYQSVKDLLIRTNHLENDPAYHMLLKYKASLKQESTDDSES